MNFDDLIDFANEVHNDISRYERSFILNPARLLADDFYVANLDWQAIQYGRAGLEQVPDDRRGIYAFSVRVDSAILPPHGYILYLGIAGRNSHRSLRERYQDYLNLNKVRKRAGIARMIADWHAVLQFIFAPVDDNMTSEALQILETQLNTALIPPYSEQDIDADVRTRRRAWR